MTQVRITVKAQGKRPSTRLKKGRNIIKATEHLIHFEYEIDCTSGEDTKAFARQILDLLVDQHHISGDRIRLKKATNKSREYEIVHNDIQV